MGRTSDIISFYRRQAAKLPNGDPLAEEAKETWKLGHPRMYRLLERIGVLDDAAKLAAANYRDYVARLIEQGASHDQAVESAAHEFFAVEPMRRLRRHEIELAESSGIAAFEKWLSTLEDQGNRPRSPGVSE